MIDPNAEIQRLRQRLLLKGMPNTIADQICDDVAIEISRRTSDILADAMNDAVNAGGDAMSIDFIDEIRAVRSGASFDIITDSGKTDFSEPPFPMLPKLLQNAKVAKDGSLYKVIPIKQKSGSKRNDVSMTTEAAYSNIENARRRAKEERDLNNRDSSSPDALQGMSTISAMQTISKSRQANAKANSKNNAPAIAFRTASSKQNAASSWVHPGRSIDMSRALANINANLHDSIDKAIEEIIRMHEGAY